ncbi:hypothetical protein [Streptomyces echinatus]|uniref:hypothetical protein n=1 Tax=Streptomyces echinatus TaxID=67293 RepID=UPI0031ECA8C4
MPDRRALRRLPALLAVAGHRRGPERYWRAALAGFQSPPKLPRGPAAPPRPTGLSSSESVRMTLDG